MHPGRLLAGEPLDVAREEPLFTIPPARIGQVRVEQTIVGGEVVYRARQVAVSDRQMARLNRAPGT